MNWFRLAQPVILAWGWRRAALAFGAGAVSALAMAPVNLWPVLFLTFPPLVWLIDGAAAGRSGSAGPAFVAGWWFGFGYFLAGLYWIGYAFLVDARTFGWLLPVAVTVLPAGLAVFTGFGVALARLLWTPGPLRILTLAAALTTSEWLRGHVLTGFPWNAFGYALTTPLALAQSAAVFGIWGLTFIAVAVFASPAVLADDRKRWRFLPVIGAVCLLAVLAVFGAIRLALAPTEMVDGVRLRIMQPNVQQDEKFNYSAKNEVMRRYLDLSQGAASGAPLDGITHLIWPESAFPFFLTREPEALAAIAKVLPSTTVLITGAARLAESVPGVRGVHAYNSIYVIDHNGSILSIYDKLHLVPFGEYLPFQSFLESLGLMQLTKMPGGFRPRRPAAPDCRAGRPRDAAAAVLRGHLSRRGGAARRAAGVALESHQRCLVRHQLRALPAPSAGARARRRRGTAAHSHRKQRRVGGDRPVGPHRAIASARERRNARFQVAAANCRHDLRANWRPVVVARHRCDLRRGARNTCSEIAKVASTTNACNGGRQV